MADTGAKAFWVCVFCCCSAWAQLSPRQSFTIGYLGGIPTGRNAWRAGSEITAAYGLRVQRHVQADVGIDAIFRPLDPGELTTRFNFHPDDRVLLIPFGGRVVAGAAGGRWLLGAGLGAAHMRYGTRPVAAVSLASYSGWGGSDSALLWAATLAWTPVFAIYGPIYDAVLLVPALLLLVAGRLYARGPKLPESLRFLVTAVYVVPWFTQALARATGVQIFTLTAAALGAYALHLARQPNKLSRSQTA